MRGNPIRSLLWKVDKITPHVTKCALQQVPSDAKALLVEDNVELAQNYLNISSPPSSFACTK